ncbi:MAG: DUF1778 domain-containing protein [Acidobacteriaceae bacterium]|nr:DUF1778 domain-containing protein [Acidobacteriaceae bacterium]
MPVTKKRHTSTDKGRFEARVSPEKKLLWQKAAKLRGNTLTEFVVNSAVEVAERTIKEAEFMELTYRDRAAFVQALLNAPASPNAKLRKAAKRHAQVFAS